MKSVFKILIITMLGLTVVGCSLLDEVNREDKERGRTCYRTRSGLFYCEDTK